MTARTRSSTRCGRTITAAGLAIAAILPQAAHAQPAANGAGLLDLCLSAFRHVAPETLLSSWSFAPQSLLPLILLIALYGAGASTLGRDGKPLTAGQVALFAAGWAALAIALLSPLCRMAAGMASAHMGQHVILAAIAPPLLILGRAGVALTALRPTGSVRPSVVRAGYGAYAAVTALYGAAIWLWHAPAVYELVLQSGLAHVISYAGLIAISLLFWSRTLSLGHSAGALAAGLALLITTIHTGFLGALLTIAPSPWFASATGGPLWGLTPLEDQQVAGLIMWAPMAGVYLAGTLALLYRALEQMGRDGAPALPRS